MNNQNRNVVAPLEVETILLRRVPDEFLAHAHHWLAGHAYDRPRGSIAARARHPDGGAARED